jgi:hypothetical protein
VVDRLTLPVCCGAASHCQDVLDAEPIAAARAELSDALRFLDMVPSNCRQLVKAAIEHVEHANELLGERGSDSIHGEGSVTNHR